MCGISGILNFNNKPVEKEQLLEMNRLIHHRGPDGSGIFIEDNVGLGNNRLAIIDLREISNQPMFDFDERYVITYNGEIFNYIEIRSELLKKGHKFKTNSDTEVILNSYKEYGEDCLHKLNGMWAFAIWDRKEKTLFCSRDRYGIKPFYYYRDNERLLFGSEIKQLLQEGVSRELNDDTIYDYLVFNFTDHTDRTFFKSISKLPAGFKISVSRSGFKVSRWYELSEKISDKGNTNELTEELYGLLYDSVRIRLRSDVEVGSCLSGGLDSSSIVCIMHSILKNENKSNIQKTYTACYDNAELDERKYVDEVIKQTNSDKYFLFPDAAGFLDELDKLIWHQDEPFIGATVFAQWSVFKEIHRTRLKVVLDGQGSDEIFLGYFSYYPYYLRRHLLNPLRFISEFVNGSSVSQLGLVKFTENYVYFNSPSIRYRHVTNNAMHVFNPGFVKSLAHKEIFNKTVAAESLSANRFSNLWSISLPSLLRYEDKNSMAFSVEARLPFLDHRLVEFVFSLPYDMLIKRGWTKYILREATRKIIPENIRLRKGKLAFSVPQKEWLEEIKPHIKDVVQNDFRSGKYVDKEKMLLRLDSGKYNDKVIFRAFLLEKWMKVFNL
jgi:asparagine synthase (glutamine-hydrolysing)